MKHEKIPGNPNLKLCQCCFETFTPNRIKIDKQLIPFCSHCRYPTKLVPVFLSNGEPKLNKFGNQITKKVKFTRKEFLVWIKHFKRSDYYL